MQRIEPVLQPFLHAPRMLLGELISPLSILLPQATSSLGMGHAQEVDFLYLFENHAEQRKPRPLY